jgi:hypothetical protein
MRDEKSVFVAGRLLRCWSAIERLQIACHHEKVSSRQFLTVLNLLANSPAYGGLRRLLPCSAANDASGLADEPGQTAKPGNSATMAAMALSEAE